MLQRALGRLPSAVEAGAIERAFTRAEEKAGTCGKREWGGCGFSPPPPPPLLEKEDYAD